MSRAHTQYRDLAGRGAGKGGIMLALCAPALCALAACSPAPDKASDKTGPAVADSTQNATSDGQGAAATASASSATGTVSAVTARGEALKGNVSGLTGAVSDLSVRVTETATIVDLPADVLFEFDKFALAPSADAPMQKLLTYVQAGGSGKIIVTGYTDAKGEDDYNRTLSQKRAQAVADWLTCKGVDAAHLDIVGKGEADPVAPNAKSDGSDDPDGRAKNRRVSVTIPK